MKFYNKGILHLLNIKFFIKFVYIILMRVKKTKLAYFDHFSALPLKEDTFFVAILLEKPAVFTFKQAVK